MKTVCDFCKTEYTLDKYPNLPVKCAVCGHTWVVRRPIYQNTTMKFLAAMCAFIAACVFSFVVILNAHTVSSHKKPLVARIDEKSIHIVSDANGDPRIFVAGDITNNTDEIYGLPNIVIISYDDHDNIVARQNFLPPSTLLEAHSTVTFNHLLNVDTKNVKRVSIELKESK